MRSIGIDIVKKCVVCVMDVKGNVLEDENTIRKVTKFVEITRTKYHTKGRVYAVYAQVQGILTSMQAQLHLIDPYTRHELNLDLSIYFMLHVSLLESCDRIHLLLLRSR